MGATSLMRANECRAAPSARARETGRASASAIGLLTPPLCAGTRTGLRDQDPGKVRPRAEADNQYRKTGIARQATNAKENSGRRATGLGGCLLKRELQV